MPAVRYIRWQVIWDYLQTQISSAAVPGGVLAGIANVEQVCPPEKNVFPSIGIQFDSYALEKYAMRARKVTSSYSVIIAVKQEFSATVPDTTAAALNSLRKYCDDGLGNGLSTLLTSDPTMGGFAIDSMITQMRMATWQGRGSVASTLATAIYTLQVEDVVRF
jgi:hypothetical protein